MISVQYDDFDQGAEYKALVAKSDGAGAVVTFTGLVRDLCDSDRVSAITIEHYPGMTEKALMDICVQARKRWSLGQIRIIHRIGELIAGDQIVFVGVTSKHRSEAFASAEFLMDFLKTKAPLWKKECLPYGEKWVQPKTSDQQARQRWEAVR